ncbi:glycosyltransferase [Acinetobacter schindleri]|uniref:glycosyltransferase n=1 Tax=Acinetobacter schindleri TaxID=108981 RepID=UPI0028D7EA9F|nr:glycosyltransferase [Acinetobacter schindleri]
MNQLKNRIKLLIDASIVAKGGGVQVAYSFICNIVKDPSFDLVLVVSPQLDKQLPNDLKLEVPHYYVEKNEPIWKKHEQARRLVKIESLHLPDLVFVIFGPSYWRPKSLCLQGFALPLLVYPETRNLVYKSDLKIYFYQKILNWYKGFLFKKNADFAIVETETFKKKLSAVLGFSLSRIYVVENSFNVNFKDKENKINKVNKEVSIFIPSAFYPHKNLEILIDVACLLKTENFDFKFNFLLDSQSLEWKKIVKLAELKNVAHFFNTYGVVANTMMKNLYEKNDLVLLPTLAEASTAVYPEAFVSDRVLLTSDLDFARELCGEAAIYFNPHDPQDIANKICSIALNQAQQDNLILNGNKQLKISYVTPEEKWEKQRAVLLDIYRNVI